MTMQAPAPLHFWFDFASPYGYFMGEKIDALAARHGRSVRWRPILLFAVLRALGLPAPLENPVKRDYMAHDFERSARHLGVDFRLPPGFPAITQHAARGFYLLEAVDAQAAVRFARGVMRAYFVDATPIGDPAVVARWLAAQAPVLGNADTCLQLLQGAQARSLLAAAVDEAVRQRVFGSPFVMVDGEPFFGVDRLPQIDAVLAGALASRPFTALAPP